MSVLFLYFFKYHHWKLNILKQCKDMNFLRNNFYQNNKTKTPFQQLKYHSVAECCLETRNKFVKKL